MLRWLHVGRCDDVVVRFIESKRQETPASRASIERCWAEKTAAGLPLFDGPMCRLEAFHVEHRPNTGGVLRLDVSRTSYRVFLGTNLHGPRDLPAAALANPIGVSPALESADGMLLLGRRNGRVAYYPHRLHPFSGSLEPDRLAAGGGVADEVRRELAEELNLAPAEVPEVACVGIVEDADIRHPELIFHARVAVSAAEALARLDPAEHAAAAAVEATPEAVAAAAADKDLTPVGRASLLLFGLGRFGGDWFGGAGGGV